PAARFRSPVAPPLAARKEGAKVPSVEVLATAKPNTARKLLIETFGSPFSSLTETELQLALIERFNLPAILVSSSALGTIGRTLQCLQALRIHGVHPIAVVLLGPLDEFATEQIRRHSPEAPVYCLQSPRAWTREEIRRSATEQKVPLEE